MRTSLSAVIPGRRASVEPGIHIHRLWLWIPGLRLSAHPGMTVERDVRTPLRSQDDSRVLLRRLFGFAEIRTVGEPDSFVQRGLRVPAELFEPRDIEQLARRAVG